MLQKVCHLTSVHPVDDVRIFVKECTSLAANGFDVTLVACGDVAFEDIKNGVKRILLYIPVKNRLQRIVKRTKAVYKKALQVNADIYHFHDPELLPIGKKLKKNGKKVVYDAHEDVAQQILLKDYFPIMLKKPISFITKYIENHYVRLLDAVVTVTEHIAKRFSQVAKKVIVCSNYASLSEFDEFPGWGNQRDSICYVGNISRLRGIVEMACAAEKVGVSLELAGNFGSKSLEYQIINKKNVNYRGWVNRNELINIFTRCFAGMVTLHNAPNITYSSPVKLYEYMASGIPVIASNFENWKPIIEGNNAGLCVDPTNIESISNAILFLRDNPQIAQQMGLNGRNAFKEKYNWQIEEKKIIKLYSEL